MKISRGNLLELRDGIERLMDYILDLEGGAPPCFYRYFDTMKNNIELFSRFGGDDLDRLVSLLERDWNASHTMFIGIQEYDPTEKNPDADPEVAIHFAELVADVGKYF